MATTVEGDSAHAVAFRLFEKIEIKETNAGVAEKGAGYRDYALKLFEQCLGAAEGARK